MRSEIKKKRGEQLPLPCTPVGSGQLGQTGKLVEESTVIISSGFNKEYKMAARQGFRVRKVHLSLLQERQKNLNLNQFLSF